MWILTSGHGAHAQISQQAKLTASDVAARDQFGYSVAVAGDTAVIGAYRDDDAGSNSGSAYAFVRTGTSWSQQAKLMASDAAAKFSARSNRSSRRARHAL